LDNRAPAGRGFPKFFPPTPKPRWYAQPVGDPSEQDLTLLLRAVRDGDRDALARLFTLTYNDLRRIAANIRFVGKRGGTMQPTALANEAFIHFSKGLDKGGQVSSADFYKRVAMNMRTILRDHWRWKHRQRRDPGALLHLDHEPQSPDDADALGALDLEALDGAVDRLEKYNARWHDVVVTRFYAARSIEETANALGLSVTTVKSDWRLARGWLRRDLEGRP
jgi:RNA polymerase sigma factor (TIGR02999 family)